MSPEYEKYEAKCEKIREDNNELILLFRKQLVEDGLSERTIERHIGNIEFYINDYLLRSDAYPMEYGTSEISLFLGYYAIRTCLCSSAYELKAVAASIKKFYKCMLENGKIKNANYYVLCSTIKTEMPEWVAACKQFNDPKRPSPFQL